MPSIGQNLFQILQNLAMSENFRNNKIRTDEIQNEMHAEHKGSSTC